MNPAALVTNTFHVLELLLLPARARLIAVDAVNNVHSQNNAYQNNEDYKVFNAGAILQKSFV